MIYEYTATDYKFATPFNFILLGTFYIALHILQETITQTFRMPPVVFVVYYSRYLYHKGPKFQNCEITNYWR